MAFPVGHDGGGLVVYGPDVMVKNQGPKQDKDTSPPVPATHSERENKKWAAIFFGIFPLQILELMDRGDSANCQHQTDIGRVVHGALQMARAATATANSAKRFAEPPDIPSLGPDLIIHW